MSLKKILITFFFVFILLLLAVFYLIGQSCEESSDRYSLSKNSKYEALLKKSDCGATTSETNEVFIVKNGKDKSWFQRPVFFADKVDGLKIEWIGSVDLLISYKHARVHKYKSYWYDLEGNDFEQVNIGLKNLSSFNREEEITKRTVGAFDSNKLEESHVIEYGYIDLSFEGTVLYQNFTAYQSRVIEDGHFRGAIWLETDATDFIAPFYGVVTGRLMNGISGHKGLFIKKMVDVKIYDSHGSRVR